MTTFESNSHTIDDWQAEQWVKELSQFAKDDNKSAFLGKNHTENAPAKNRNVENIFMNVNLHAKPIKDTRHSSSGEDEDEDEDDAPAQITISLASLLKTSKIEDEGPALIQCTLTDLVLGSKSETIRDAITSLNNGEKPKTKSNNPDVASLQLYGDNIDSKHDLPAPQTMELTTATQVAKHQPNRQSASNDQAQAKTDEPKSPVCANIHFTDPQSSSSSSSSSLPKSKLNVNATPFEFVISKDSYNFDPSEYYEPSTTFQYPLGMVPPLGGCKTLSYTVQSPENRLVPSVQTMPSLGTAGCSHEFNGEIYYDDDDII